MILSVFMIYGMSGAGQAMVRRHERNAPLGYRGVARKRLGVDWQVGSKLPGCSKLRQRHERWCRKTCEHRGGVCRLDSGNSPRLAVSPVLRGCTTRNMAGFAWQQGREGDGSSGRIHFRYSVPGGWSLKSIAGGDREVWAKQSTIPVTENSN